MNLAAMRGRNREQVNLKSKLWAEIARLGYSVLPVVHYGPYSRERPVHDRFYDLNVSTTFMLNVNRYLDGYRYE